MKKTDNFSTIVWVSIFVQPKFLLRVHCFGQNSSQKVLPCRMMIVGLWPLVWRVERSKSWFLAISLVEIDGLLTFGHSVKWPYTFIFHVQQIFRILLMVISKSGRSIFWYCVDTILVWNSGWCLLCYAFTILFY